MAYTLDWNGDPNNTSGFTSFPNNWVWSGTNTTFPGGNVDFNGNRLVRVWQIGADNATGAAGIFSRISFGGSWTDGNQTIVNPGSSFWHEIHYSSGTLHFGRNTGVPGVVTNQADGNTWGGGLPGWLTWSTVPTATGTPLVTSQPGGKASVSWSGVGSDGGEGIQNYLVHYSTASNFSGAQQVIVTSTSATVTGLTPGTVYYFRVSAYNGIGNSAWSGTGSALIRSGGKRWDGATWKPQRVRRWDGATWKDQRVRRWDGTTWRDIQ